MAKKKPLFNSSTLTLNNQLFELSYINENNLDTILDIELRSHPQPWNRQNFNSSLASHHCIGLQCQGKYVAYAVLSFVVGEAELLLFVVDKPWHGKGLASAFLRQIISHASALAQSMFLEVRASNQAAINLYEAVGFNEVGLRPNYYPSSSGKREDAILMALDIVKVD